MIATHFPFTDRGLFFARVHAERSYCVAAPLSGEAPDGMFISASAPTRSLRFHPVGGRELLIVGGEGHKVGQGGPTSPRYMALEAFMREHFDVREIAYRWSAQDNYSADGAPLVGKLTPRSQGSYVATGYRKWGLAMAAAAAEIITDAIAGRKNPWQDFFDSNRLTPFSSAKALVTENANVAFHFFADRVTRRSGDTRTRSRARRGQGRLEARPAGGHLQDDGRDGPRRLGPLHPPGLHRRLERRRTHVGLPLPRVAVRRRRSVLQGPAVHPLEKRP